MPPDPQLMLSVSLSLEAATAHWSPFDTKQSKKIFFLLQCLVSIAFTVHSFIINVHGELRYVPKLYSFWCKKELVLLWDFVIF